MADVCRKRGRTVTVKISYYLCNHPIKHQENILLLFYITYKKRKELYLCLLYVKITSIMPGHPPPTEITLGFLYHELTQFRNSIEQQNNNLQNELQQLRNTLEIDINNLQTSQCDLGKSQKFLSQEYEKFRKTTDNLLNENTKLKKK